MLKSNSAIMSSNITPVPKDNKLRNIGRYLLACILLVPGVAHLSFARDEFKAQVPDWIPMNKDLVVVASGYVELALGAGLLALPKQKRAMGWIIGTFFLLIFPGNISQFIDQRDGFGLDTDLKRGIRLLFQPLLIALALWSTRALCSSRVE